MFYSFICYAVVSAIGIVDYSFFSVQMCICSCVSGSRPGSIIEPFEMKLVLDGGGDNVVTASEQVLKKNSQSSTLCG